MTAQIFGPVNIKTAKRFRFFAFVDKDKYNFVFQQVGNWGSELGLNVLRGLSKLYTSLVWESNILLALCNEDALPAGCEFGKADMDKLVSRTFSSKVQHQMAIS